MSPSLVLGLVLLALVLLAVFCAPSAPPAKTCVIADASGDVLAKCAAPSCDAVGRDLHGLLPHSVKSVPTVKAAAEKSAIAPSCDTLLDRVACASSVPQTEQACEAAAAAYCTDTDQWMNGVSCLAATARCS